MAAKPIGPARTDQVFSLFKADFTLNDPLAVISGVVTRGCEQYDERYTTSMKNIKRPQLLFSVAILFSGSLVAAVISLLDLK